VPVASGIFAIQPVYLIKSWIRKYHAAFGCYRKLLWSLDFNMNPLCSVVAQILAKGGIATLAPAFFGKFLATFRPTGSRNAISLGRGLWSTTKCV
jgi:hypothetical protein